MLSHLSIPVTRAEPLSKRNLLAKRARPRIHTGRRDTRATIGLMAPEQPQPDVAFGHRFVI